LIRSMTGYGRGESERAGKVFIAEIRSVNNRFREVIVRIPRTFQVLEQEIRSQVASRMRRGRIDVSIQIEREGEELIRLELNSPLVTSYLRIMKQLSDEFGLDDRVNPLDLCQLKDVILFKPEDSDPRDLKTGIQQVMATALDSCDAMRIQEGMSIEEDFKKRILLIRRYLDEIEARTGLVVEDYRRKLHEKIQLLGNGITLDDGRLVQEVAIHAEKCDITEEISRGRSHLDQFENFLSSEESIGRKLDFLLQEIHREINTMSAKASDASISIKAVEVKAELEKLREQVQNVE
jgi:uncharacterized protein (TIGR00255 family)